MLIVERQLNLSRDTVTNCQVSYICLTTGASSTTRPLPPNTTRLSRIPTTRFWPWDGIEAPVILLTLSLISTVFSLKGFKTRALDAQHF
jgi:hypothetical protein